MKRIAILIIIFNSLNLFGQTTEEVESVASNPNNLVLHPSSVTRWNGKTIFTGALQYNLGCGLYYVDSTYLNAGGYVWQYSFNGYCDKVSCSAEIGADCIALTGTLSNAPSGIYPKPFVLLLDTLFQPLLSFVIDDSSQYIQINPKLAAMPDNGFVVSWTAGNGEGRIVRFNHSGNLVWGEKISALGIFYVDDLAVRNDGTIIIAGRNQTSQGSQPTIVTLDSLGSVMRTLSIAEQQSDPVSISVVENTTAMAFCTPDPLSQYNLLNILLLDQYDSIILKKTYYTWYGTFSDATVHLFNDTTWLLSGNFSQPSWWPSVGFYIKGDDSNPLINTSFIGDFTYSTKFYSSAIDSSGKIWTVGDRDDGSNGLYIKTGMPVDDCNNFLFSVLSNPYNPTTISDTFNIQLYSPIMYDPLASPSLGAEYFNWMCISGVDGENTENDFQVEVFPNPVITNATFQMTGFDGNKTLIIYDQLGKEIWRKESFENQVEFSVEGISSGLYFYRIESNGGNKANGKFIIE